MIPDFSISGKPRLKNPVLPESVGRSRARAALENSAGEFGLIFSAKGMNIAHYFLSSTAVWEANGPSADKVPYAFPKNRSCLTLAVSQTWPP